MKPSGPNSAEEYDPSYDPNYSKKFHKLESEESNAMKVQRSLYDEEAKEVSSPQAKRYNEIINNQENDALVKSQDET